MRGRVDSAYKVGKPSVNVSQLAACLSVDEQHLGFGASQEVLLALLARVTLAPLPFDWSNAGMRRHQIPWIFISSHLQAAGAGWGWSYRRGSFCFLDLSLPNPLKLFIIRCFDVGSVCHICQELIPDSFSLFIFCNYLNLSYESQLGMPKSTNSTNNV